MHIVNAIKDPRRKVKMPDHVGGGFQTSVYIVHVTSIEVKRILFLFFLL